MSFIKTHRTKNCKEFLPKYTEKYTGKLPIICRSGWEVAFCKWCDHNPSVLEWSSESIEIKYPHPYFKTAQGTPQFRRYYPDFFIKVKDSHGNVRKYVIEVKPEKETVPPDGPRRGKSRKTILEERKRWDINKAKWKAAMNVCNKMGYYFKILTEKQLFRGS